MSQESAPSVGQVSADGQFRWDGQQWVPLATNFREPTPWTRPMQLITAGLFAFSAISSLIFTFIYVNHDSVLRAIKAQGTQLPAGTNIDSVVNVSVGVTYGFVIFFAILGLVVAIGSYLGWRWMFWAALVLFALGGITAFTNLGSLANPDRSPVPRSGLIVSELFALIDIAMFVWMLIAVIRYGPWAMKKPGS